MSRKIYRELEMERVARGIDADAISLEQLTGKRYQSDTDEDTPSHGYYSFYIEQLCRSVEKSKTVAFKVEKKINGDETSEVIKPFKLADSLIGLPHPEKSLAAPNEELLINPLIELYCDALKSSGLTKDDFKNAVNEAELALGVNEFTSKLRALLWDSSFRRARDAWDQRCISNYSRCAAMLKNIRNHSEQMLVVGMDLAVTRAYLPLRADQMVGFLEMLLRKKNNLVIKKIQAVIVRVTFTPLIGYSLHVKFIYVEHFLPRIDQYAYQLGVVWQQMMGNQGVCVDSTNHINPLKQAGLGVIRKEDELGFQELLASVAYLAKSERYVVANSELRGWMV